MDQKLQYDIDSDDSSGERQLHILPPLSLPAAKSRKKTATTALPNKNGGATTSPTGSPPSALALGAPGLTPSAPSREMGCSAMCACVCVWISRCALQCHRAWEGIRSPQQFTLKAVPRIKKAFLQLRKPNKSESRHLRFTTDY